MYHTASSRNINDDFSDSCDFHDFRDFRDYCSSMLELGIHYLFIIFSMIFYPIYFENINITRTRIKILYEYMNI